MKDLLSAGIPSLNKSIDEGLNEEGVILIVGQPGTDKATLRVQFKYNGAVQYNQANVYATSGESGSKLESNLEQFKVRRRLYIPKMCDLNHALDCYDFFVTPEGISQSPNPITSR